MKMVNKNMIKNIEDDFGIKVLYLTLSGSKLYVTATPNSDTNYKGIFIPTIEQIILSKAPNVITRNTNNSNEKNSKDDIDFTLYNITEFFNHLKKSEIGAIDILFSMFNKDNIVFENEEFTKLMKENYELFLNENVKSFIDYILGQTKKFGIKGARYNDLKNNVTVFDELNVHTDEKTSPKVDNLLLEIFNRLNRGKRVLNNK